MARIRRVKPPKVVTVIGEGTTIEGHVRFSGALHLDGTIKGGVTGEPGADATLIISEQGRIEGDVHVEHLIADGRIVGDVHAAQRVELAAHGRITGTLYYQLLEMAMGAEVNGKLVHSEAKEPQRLGYDGPNDETEESAETRISGNPGRDNDSADDPTRTGRESSETAHRGRSG